MEDAIDLLKVLGFLVSALVLILNIANFLYARFGENTKVTTAIATIKTEHDALQKDFELLSTETLKELELSIRNHIRENHIELIRRLAIVEQISSSWAETKPKIDLFWEFVRENFPKMLLKHGEPMRDELLMKLANNTIKHLEGIDLKAMLENEYEHLDDKRSTEAMINVMTRLSLEAILKEEGRW